MSTDLNTILALKQELDIYADSLREAKTKLVRHKDTLDTVWHASEISMIDDAIDDIDRKLARIADELNDIASDVLKAHQQIEEERIAREQAEREAKERQEQERLERERAEQRAREQAEQRAREEAEQRARKEAEEREKAEAEARTREEQEREARERETREKDAQETTQTKSALDVATSFFSWLFRR